MPVERADCPPHTVPVQWLRPGDHAFVRYDSDIAHWEVAAAFVRSGLEQGAKVFVLGDPRIPAGEALLRLGIGGGLAQTLATAHHQGRLVLTTMREFIGPAPGFAVQRQWDRLREETAGAVREGYTGLRAFIDMAWVRDLGVDIDTVILRETSADHLFAGRDYTELCAYDGRWFSERVLDAMCRAHPQTVLAGLGILRSVCADGSVRLIGDADLNTRVAFCEALRDGLARTLPSRSLTVDLTRLHFLSTGCATDLLLLASGATGHDRVEVRCAPFHAHTLRRLGAESVEPLALVEVECAC